MMSLSHKTGRSMTRTTGLRYLGDGAWLPGTFLARLSGSAVNELLTVCGSRHVERGGTLTVQGEWGTDIHVIEAADLEAAACVKVTAATRNGHEALLGIRLAGDLIGELSALSDGRRTATVTACADLICHTVTYPKFTAFLSRDPVRWEEFCRMLVERLSWSNRRRLDFAAYSVRARLARVILELVERHGKANGSGLELGVKLSQEELGRLIAAGTDAVAKALARLRAEGLVSSRYRGLLVTDPAALRRVAESE
jgi:CRP-like cAMP-binding protein